VNEQAAATPFLLAVDVGTSALKAVIYSRGGQALASCSRRYGYTTPQPGWAEADPQAWWDAFDAVVAELGQQGNKLGQVQVLALTGQMHTAVLLDAAGEVLAPTILWLDRRAVAETSALQARFKLPPYHLNSTYTLPKLLWLARHRPDVLRATTCILWPKDYLRYRLTGQQLTDYTEAGGAALLDWTTHTWATERLATVGLDPAVLPPMHRPEEDGGSLLPQLAARYGLREDVKIIVGAGDVLALVAGAPPRVGQVTCSLGSSSMVFAPLARGQNVRDPRGRIYTYLLLSYPLLGGVSSTTGAAVQWAWQSLYEEQIPFEAAVQQALTTPAGAEGLVFLPFLSGERSPFWNDGLRAAFYGLTLAHRRPHMLRAVIEGVAFSLRYLLDIFAALGVALDSIALAGGGASVAGWPQLMADVCQRPVHVYTGEETVTRALYAYACLAVDAGDDFAAALARTFAAPVVYQPAQAGDVYDAHYRRYCQLAEFADGTLSQL
jgi:xylulokinase